METQEPEFFSSVQPLAGYETNRLSTLVYRKNDLWAELVRACRENRMLCAVGHSSPGLPLTDLDVKLEPISIEQAQKTYAKYLQHEEAWSPGYGSRLLEAITASGKGDPRSVFYSHPEISDYAGNLSDTLANIIYETAFVARECSAANAVAIAWMFLDRDQREKCGGLAASINLIAEQIESLNSGYEILLHREDADARPRKSLAPLSQLMQVRNVEEFLFDSLDRTYELSACLQSQNPDASGFTDEITATICELADWAIVAIEKLYQISASRYTYLTSIPPEPYRAVSDFAFLIPGFVLSSIGPCDYHRGRGGVSCFMSQPSRDRLSLSAYGVRPAIFPPPGRETFPARARDWMYPVNYSVWTEEQRLWYEGYVLSGWVNFLYKLFLDYASGGEGDFE